MKNIYFWVGVGIVVLIVLAYVLVGTTSTNPVPEPSKSSESRHENLPQSDQKGTQKENRGPIIQAFSGPTTVKVRETGTWGVVVTDPENDELRYVVRWGDEPSSKDVTYPFNWPSVGAATSYSSSTFTHAYTKPGTYQAIAAVIDCNLYEDSCDANHATEKTMIITVVP